MLASAGERLERRLAFLSRQGRVFLVSDARHRGDRRR
jgi:hypothetical protein